MTTRAELASSVPQISALTPRLPLGSSLTSLEDPYGSRYTNPYRQPLRFHLPPTELPLTNPPPPAAYTYAPPRDTRPQPLSRMHHQGLASPSDSSVQSERHRYHLKHTLKHTCAERSPTFAYWSKVGRM